MGGESASVIREYAAMDFSSFDPLAFWLLGLGMTLAYTLDRCELPLPDSVFISVTVDAARKKEFQLCYS